MVAVNDIVLLRAKANTRNGVSATVVKIEPNGSCTVDINGHSCTYSAASMQCAQRIGRVSKQHTTRYSLNRTAPSDRGHTQTSPSTKVKGAQKKRGVAGAYIYMAQLGSDHVKIGRTRNVKNRMKSLQTAVPFAVRVLKTWKVATGDAARLETTVKHSFQKKFHQGGGGTEVFQMYKPDHGRAIKMIDRRARCVQKEGVC